MSILAALPIVGDIFKAAKDLISEAITDKDKKNELENNLQILELQTQNQILEMEHEEKLAQIDVNKIEAASNDAYVRRARPTILWICGAALAYSFLIYPLFCWGLTVISIWYPEVAKITSPPNLSITELFPVLLGMLGLSGYRTVEKIKGVVGK